MSKVTVQYRNTPVTYDVAPQEIEVYILILNEGANTTNGEEIPKKWSSEGKIWVSDMENFQELVNALTLEITRFNSQKSR